MLEKGQDQKRDLAGLEFPSRQENHDDDGGRRRRRRETRVLLDKTKLKE